MEKTELKIDGVFDLSKSGMTNDDFQKELLTFIESKNVSLGCVFYDYLDIKEEESRIDELTNENIRLKKENVYLTNFGNKLEIKLNKIEDILKKINVSSVLNKIEEIIEE